MHEIANHFHPDFISVYLRGNQSRCLCWFMRGGRSVNPYFMVKMAVGVTLVKQILLFQPCLEEIIQQQSAKHHVSLAPAAVIQ